MTRAAPTGGTSRAARRRRQPLGPAGLHAELGSLLRSGISARYGERRRRYRALGLGEVA